MSDTIRVVLADDHPALRLGIRVLLEQAAGLELVGEAQDGIQALELVQALQPDVVILDCRLPGMDGMEVAEQIHQRGLPTRVVALSAYDDKQYVSRMMRAGALGYVLKDEGPGAIVLAVRAAARGEQYHSPRLASKAARPDRAGRPAGLTERETEVLQLVSKGLRNKQIARSLGVKVRTVEFHVSSILSKLGVASRVEAALWAKDHNLAS